MDGTVGGTDLQLRHRLQRDALLRLAKTYSHTLGPLTVNRIVDPLGTVRKLVAILEKEGIDPT